MGCGGSKQAEQPKQEKKTDVKQSEPMYGTLLEKPQPSWRKSVPDLTLQQQVKHVMLRVTTAKPDRVVEILKSPDVRKALDGLQGLMDIEVSLCEEGSSSVVTHARFENDASLQASGAEFGELMKQIEACHEGEEKPVNFRATGGGVRQSGAVLIGFKTSAFAAKAGDDETKTAGDDSKETEVDEKTQDADKDGEKTQAAGKDGEEATLGVSAQDNGNDGQETTTGEEAKKNEEPVLEERENGLSCDCGFWGKA